MAAKKISNNIYWVGAIDWNRTLFDALVTTPCGTSYNAYIICGSEKTALVDSVDPTLQDSLINNLKQLNINKIDYIIANHAEQDHSGSIPKILELYPDARVVTNAKCKDLLKSHLLIKDEHFITVSDRDTLSLGDKHVEFIQIPWAHWPDSMMSYVQEDKVLMTNDLFGSHYATSDIFVKDNGILTEYIKRYYAEIMMPYRNQIKKHIEKIKNLDVRLIAPSHGPLYNDPDFIINLYEDWVSDAVQNKVLIPYVTMHGSTKAMVDYTVNSLIKKGIGVKQVDLTSTDTGLLAMEMVDCATLLLGSCTVLIGPHPAAAYAAYLANALKPKIKYLSVIGSYGWGTKIVDKVKDLTQNLNAEILNPVIIKGYPRQNDFELLDNLVSEIETSHKKLYENGLLKK